MGGREEAQNSANDEKQEAFVRLMTWAAEVPLRNRERKGHLNAKGKNPCESQAKGSGDRTFGCGKTSREQARSPEKEREEKNGASLDKWCEVKPPNTKTRLMVRK